MKRIHVVGISPRSGTTLLAELMIACFEIDLHEEHEASLFADPPRPGDLYLTKRPRDILIVGPMLRVDPDLWVLCMIRDPRDIIVSRHGRDPDRYWAGLKFWKTYGPQVRSLESHPRFVTIRYEALVSDPDGVQKLLMERLPFLVARAKFSEYHAVAHPSDLSLEALGPLRPIDRASIGTWRRHLPRIAGQIRMHGSISEDLIRYGYESDRGWETLLDGVEADLTPSHQPERFTLRNYWRLRRGRYLGAIRVLVRRWIARLRS